VVVAELLAARPDAVVVDMGWPAGDERRSRARLSTFGAARVSIDTVTGMLAGGTDPSLSACGPSGPAPKAPRAGSAASQPETMAADPPTFPGRTTRG
jgi:hypothetical protein